MAFLLIRGRAPGSAIHLTNTCFEVRDDARQAGATPNDVRRLYQKAAVAYQWLRNEGFVAPNPEGSGSWDLSPMP